jgi:membrane associated rhomboid family serine protease
MHLPKVTRNLLWIIALVYLAQQFLGDGLMSFMLWPLQAVFISTGSDGLPVSMGFQSWQLLTYGFMHDPSGFGHLFFNGIALYQFGGRLEEVWGGRRYLTFFLVCIIGAGICQLAFMAWMPETAGPTIGASGGVYGLLMAYAMLFPRERVMLLVPPIPMSARTLVIVFGALSLLMGVTGTAGGIAHFAHLGGMLFGWLLIRYWRGQPPFTQKRQGPWGV